jgi:phenylacetaldehyde dehydrogenase
MTSTDTIDHGASRFAARTHGMLIGGKWGPAASGETFTTIDPSTEQVLAEIPRGGAEDIDRAVRAARAAFDEGSPWRRMTPSERGKVLHRVGDLILEHADELAMLEAMDNGKPVTVARAADVAFAADVFHYMSGWATKIEGNTIPSSAGDYLAFTLREPVGVVGAVIAWNFPLLLCAWKLGPALAAGCTVVLKPAQQTPLTALRLGEILQEAGLPDGVVNVVPGFGDAGARLAEHPDVDKVTFTGSTAVGKKILHAAGGNLKRLTLELGGKSPNVVFADADLSIAVPAAASAIFFNHGQACNAGSRLYVERPVFDEFIAGMSEYARNIKLGPGVDPTTDMGPLVSDVQRDRVMGYLDSGYADGAVAAIGGKSWGDRGYFVEPTVLTGTRPDMKVVQEEIFGPVVVAMPFDDPNEIVATANDSRYGLAAGVFTRDIARAYRTASQLRAGTVWVNCYHVFNAAVPFGGYKESGWGRELGHSALEDYLETKSVVTQL